MNEQPRFYLDEHVDPAVASGLRRRGVDVLTTQEARMLGASDLEHLDFSSKEGRIIFTQDNDFLRLNAGNAEHAGIVYARQRTPIGHIVQGLTLIAQVLTAKEMRNRAEFL